MIKFNTLVKYKLSLFKNKFLLLTLSLAFFICTILFLIHRSFNYALLTAYAYAERYHSELINNFTDNENIAEAIAVSYFVNYQQRTDTCSNTEYLDTTSPFNSTQSITPTFKGELQSTVPLTYDMCETIRSIESVFSAAPVKRNLKNLTRYFLSASETWMYVVNDLNRKKYYFDASRIKTYKLFDNIPGYLYRKFTYDAKYKGRVSTDIYLDALNNELSYSIISFVYDLGHLRSHRVLGVLVYDYRASDQRKILKNVAPELNDQFTSVKIHSKDSGKDMFIIGNTTYSSLFTLQLSHKYDIVFSLDWTRYLIHSPYVMHYLLLTLLLTAAFFMLSLKYFVKKNTENLTDQLTGLYNRKVFNYIAAGQLMKVKTLALLDCNGFKQINDTWGHDLGDHALMNIARHIRICVEEELGLAIRLGGDEFCILLNIDSTDAAQKLIAKINKRCATFSDKITLSVTGGIVGLAPHESIKEALIRADQELYKNKKAKRATV